MKNEPRVDSVVELADQRKLAFAEYGAPDGAPVFLFHGLPGSRLSWGLLPDNPFPSGLRIIAPDRPGYGNSTPKPGRTHIDWVGDVSELSSVLAIERFAVVGVSGGGPGTLACAFKIPERLTSVVVVSAPAPTNAPGVMKGMSKTNRFFIKLAGRLPLLSSLNIRLLAHVIHRNPTRYINAMKYKLDGSDRTILARPEVQHMLATDFNEALRQGASGMLDDMSANHGRPWGFPLQKIETKVRLWYCEHDRSVPPAMGEYLGKTIPNCETTFVRGAGHLWILEHLHEVLNGLGN